MIRLMEKYYRVLDIEPDATPDEVRQAYLDLLRVWNPEQFSDDPRLQKKAKRKLKEAFEAYNEIVAIQAALKPRASIADSSRALSGSMPAELTHKEKGLKINAREEYGTSNTYEEAISTFTLRLLRAMILGFLIAFPVSFYFFVTSSGLAAAISFLLTWLGVIVVAFRLVRKGDRKSS